MKSQRNRHLIDKIPWKFKRGARNFIVDVQNVKVGHLNISEDVPDKSGEKVKIRTGLTAVFPDDMRKEERYFTGFFQSRGTSEVSGFAVVEDFQYLNSPIVLSNIHNFGTVYNAILSYGFGLGRSEIWPPMVLSIDDSSLDGSNGSTIHESDVLQLLANASNLSVEEGSVGIGTGLRAFGWKGGIGSSSRVFEIGGRQFTVGVLVASNFGNGWDLRESTGEADSARIGQNGTGSLTIILGTDVPLFPYQIKGIVTGIILGLPLAKFVSRTNDSLMCLLFSVANAMTMKDEGPKLFEYTLSSDDVLKRTEGAGVECVKEAILHSVCLSEPLHGKQGRKLSTMPERQLRSILRTFEETV